MESLIALQTFGDWGLLALRIALGAIFIVHGPPKLQDPSKMATGIGLPVWFAFLVGLGETLGALALFAGFLTQLGALVHACIMVGAIYFKVARWSIPFSTMEKLGWEFDLAILGGSLALLTLGGGAFAIDRTMFGL